MSSAPWAHHGDAADHWFQVISTNASCPHLRIHENVFHPPGCRSRLPFFIQRVHPLCAGFQRNGYPNLSRALMLPTTWVSFSSRVRACLLAWAAVCTLGHGLLFALFCFGRKAACKQQEQPPGYPQNKRLPPYSAFSLWQQLLKKFRFHCCFSSALTLTFSAVPSAFCTIRQASSGWSACTVTEIPFSCRRTCTSPSIPAPARLWRSWASIPTVRSRPRRRNNPPVVQPRFEPRRPGRTSPPALPG